MIRKAAAVTVRFERLKKLDKEFGQLSGALAKAFRGTKPEAAARLVDEAVRSTRKKSSRK